MSKPGIGVMLKMLFGSSEDAIDPNICKGKIIKALTQTEERLQITFEDDSILSLTDAGQSCCESRYMRSDDKTEDFIGAAFDKAELADAPASESEYGEHEVQFLRIYTSKGVYVVSNHNEHNGYYGGFALEATLTPAPSNQV